VYFNTPRKNKVEVGDWREREGRQEEMERKR
jgi:hypothetical protein